MARRTIVLAVAALAVLAGCTGGVLDDSADEPPLEEQSWADEDGVRFDALFEQHNAFVANASSLEFTQTSSSAGNRSTDVVFAVNRESERAFLNATSAYRAQTRVQETFVANGTVYSASGTAENPEYRTDQNGMPNERFEQFVDRRVSLNANGTIVSQWDFEYQGYDDGAFRFEADSATPVADAAGGLDLANATETRARLVVDERGFVRELSVRATLERGGETVTVRTTVTHANVNETTVEEPSWTDESESE